jgi:hypothetical protein
MRHVIFKLSGLVSAFAFAGVLSSASSALAQAAPADRLADDLGNFDCASGDAAQQAVCDDALAFVNDALDAALLQIDQDEPLFVYENTAHEALATGHSCTHTAKVNYRRLGARIDAEDSISLQLESLSEPVLLLREYAAVVDARVGVQEEFGTRILGKCVRLGSDSYSASGTTRTHAKLSIAFTAGPQSLERFGRGIKVTLKPTVAVSSALDSSDVPLTEVSGQDFGSIAALILGIPGTLLRTAGDLFEGESVRGTFARFTESVLRDLTFAAAPLAPEFVVDQLRLALLRGQQQAQKGFANRLQEKLQADIADVLELDADGQLTVVFSPPR